MIPGTGSPPSQMAAPTPSVVMPATSAPPGPPPGYPPEANKTSIPTQSVSEVKYNATQSQPPPQRSSSSYDRGGSSSTSYDRGNSHDRGGSGYDRGYDRGGGYDRDRSYDRHDRSGGHDRSHDRSGGYVRGGGGGGRDRGGYSSGYRGGGGGGGGGSNPPPFELRERPNIELRPTPADLQTLSVIPLSKVRPGDDRRKGVDALLDEREERDGDRARKEEVKALREVDPTLFRFHKRGSPNQTGTTTKVLMNYYKFDLGEDGRFWHQYRVDWDPWGGKGDDGSELRRALMEKAMEKISFSKDQYAYDGDAILVTAIPLQSDSFTAEAPRKASNGFPEKIYSVAVKKVGIVNIAVIEQYYQGYQEEFPQHIANAIDLILGSPLYTQYVGDRGSFFNVDGGRSVSIPGGLELFTGWHQSVRPTEWGLLVNLDIATGTFFKPQSVTSFIRDLLGRDDDMTKSKNVGLVKEYLKKAVLITTHAKGADGSPKKRRYKLDDISTENVGQINFTNHDGQSESVADYFLRQYGRKLDRRGHAIVVKKKLKDGTKHPLYVPLEMLEIAPKQKCKKKMNPAQTEAMIKFTTKKPAERERETNARVEDLLSGSTGTIKGFGLSVMPGMASASAQVLSPPKVVYQKSGGEISQQDCKRGAWNLMRKKVQVAASGGLQKWGIINFAQELERDSGRVMSRMADIAQHFGATGLNMQSRPMSDAAVFLDAGTKHRFFKDSPEQCVDDAFSEMKQRAPDAQIIFVLLPDTSVRAWQAVKYAAIVKQGMMTQCLVKGRGLRLDKLDKGTIANICIKVNAKLGGINQTVTGARNGQLLRDICSSGRGQHTMVLGGDVTHAKGGEITPSIAALVASLDLDCAQFAHEVRAQSTNEENIEEFPAMFESLVSKHCRAMRCAPADVTNIIYYRDGVADNQFQEVMALEMTQLKFAIKKLGLGGTGGACKITFCIVQKRHKIRMYQNDTRFQDSPKSGNPAPGTTVDHGPVHPGHFNFYLMSHAGIQGTSVRTKACFILQFACVCWSYVTRIPLFLWRFRCTHQLTYNAAASALQRSI